MQTSHSTLDGRRRKGGFKRSPADYYPTAEPLSEALPSIEDLGKRVWEPACGDGRLSRVFEAAGIRVVSTDLLAWGYGRESVDFLKTRRLMAPVVVTNPPFSHWYEFADHALQLGAKKVVLLGRTLLQEGATLGRLFDRHLVLVHQARRRVNLAPPGALDKGHNTKLAFAWYVLVPDKPAELGAGYLVRGFMPRLVSKARR